MAYKFFGEPNMLVMERKKKRFDGEIILKPVFRFDKNGEYITEDERLANKLKRKFKHIEMENNVTDDNPPEKIYQCKKCDFATNNMGLLMAHYREHKKEG